MKKGIRFLSILFAVVILASTAACTPKNPGKTPDSTTTTTEQPSDSIYDKNGFIKDGLPELNYNDESIIVYHWTPSNPEFEIGEDETDPVSMSVFSRNAMVEERLKIIFDFRPVGISSGAESSQFTTNIEALVLNGEPFDIIAGYSRATPMCASKGYCLNLLDSEYLDVEKPWWPNSLVEESKIGEKLYYASGDISTNLLYNMTALLYNKRLLQDNHLESPVDLVKSDEWTFETLQRLLKDIGKDQNTNYKKDADDFFGLCTMDFYMEDIFEACGLRYYEKTSEEEGQLFKLSSSFYGSRSIDLSTDLLRWNDTDDVFFSSNEQTADPGKMFANGNAVFLLSSCDVINKSGLRDVQWSYGIVPWPKYDDEQDDFSTATRYPFTMYGISSVCSDLNRAGAVLECMASEAYRKVSPEVFQRTMKLKYSDTSAESEMFDLLRSTIIFENGRLLSQTQDSNMGPLFYGTVIGKKSWATVSRQEKGRLEIEIKKLSDLFADLEK